MGPFHQAARRRSREMPPWGIDPHVGIQSFKNDPSLRPDEIEKIVKWVDAGAPMGQRRRHAEAARVRRLAIAGTSASRI